MPVVGATIAGSLPTVKVTLIVCAPLPATAPVPGATTTLPVYVPGARLAGFTDTAKCVPVVRFVVGVTLSQLPPVAVLAVTVIGICPVADAGRTAVDCAVTD